VMQYREMVAEIVTIGSLLGGVNDLPAAGSVRMLIPSFGATDRVVAIREIIDITTIGGRVTGSTIIGGKIVRVISLAEMLVTRSGAGHG